MNLNLGKKNKIFIEASVLIEETNFVFFQDLLTKSKNAEVKLYFDSLIRDDVENLKKTNREKEAYLLDGLLDIFDSSGLTSYINTKNYFDFEVLKSEFQKLKTGVNFFITNKETVYKAAADLLKTFKSLSIYKLYDSEIKNWKLEEKQKNKAFYFDEKTQKNLIKLEQIDYVFSPKYGYLRLDKTKPMSGGEADIFQTYNTFLCKIYKPEHLTYINHKKILKMIEMDISNPSIAWPIDVIYYKNNFIGYIMKNIPEATSLDILNLEGFNGMKIIDRYILARNFLEAVYYLHSRNIIVGDMKLDNILVEKPNKVYLIDCGSYQFEDYPCTVCHPDYTKKVYTNAELKMFLRSVDDEYYPINRIIFEILIGKSPHHRQDDPEINCDKTTFEYPLVLSDIQKETLDLKLWKLMSEKMRKMFYFYFKEEKVSYLREWIDEFNLFIDNANNGRN